MFNKNVQGHSQLSVPILPPTSLRFLLVERPPAPYLQYSTMKQQCYTPQLCVHVDKDPAPVFLGSVYFLECVYDPLASVERRGGEIFFFSLILADWPPPGPHVRPYQRPAATSPPQPVSCSTMWTHKDLVCPPSACPPPKLITTRTPSQERGGGGKGRRRRMTGSRCETTKKRKKVQRRRRRKEENTRRH